MSYPFEHIVRLRYFMYGAFAGIAISCTAIPLYFAIMYAIKQDLTFTNYEVFAFGWSIIFGSAFGVIAFKLRKTIRKIDPEWSAKLKV